jgi:hypothetical protein
LDFSLLKWVYDQTPGLTSDKLKAVLDLVWHNLKETNVRGIVLAYDEAQNMSDQAVARQYPLSLLLDVFQSIQKKGVPILLVLTGLPTLFPKLVDARTFAELPRQARDYVACVEELAGIPAAWISVGPERHQTIHRQA